MRSNQLSPIGADMTSASSLSLSIYNLLLYDVHYVEYRHDVIEPNLGLLYSTNLVRFPFTDMYTYWLLPLLLFLELVFTINSNKYYKKKYFSDFSIIDKVWKNIGTPVP